MTLPKKIETANFHDSSRNAKSFFSWLYDKNARNSQTKTLDEIV